MQNYTIESTFKTLSALKMPMVAVRGKRPYINDWNKKPITKCPPKGEGLGLILGESSGIWALDMDSLNKDIQQELREVIPKKYMVCARKGNPNKLPTLFFKLSESFKKAKDFGAIGVQILSNGKQTVLPPSIHPDFNIPFKWLTPPIWECDLPTPGQDLYDILSELNQKHLVRLVENGDFDTCSDDVVTHQGDTSRCAHNSHSRISQVMMRKVGVGRSFTEILKTILEEDKRINKVVSFFKCSTNGRNIHGDIKMNAMNFIMDAYKLKKQKEEGFSFSIDASEDFADVAVEGFVKPEVKQTKAKFKKITPKLTDFAADIFDYIYGNCPKPITQFAYSATIGALSTVFGNKCHLNGIYPNLYLFNIAPSTSGKDHPQRNMKAIFNAAKMGDYIGVADLNSVNSLLLELVDFPTRMFSVDEAHKIFSHANKHGGLIRDILAELYTRGGEQYNGKRLSSYQGGKKRLGEVYSPQVNTLFSTTKHAFEHQITADFIQTGLGSRFMYFFEDRDKDPKYGFSKQPVPVDIITQMQKIHSFESKKDFDPDLGFNTSSVALELENPAHFIDIQKQCVKEARIYDIEDKRRPIMNRKIENIMKLVQIFHCSRYPLDFHRRPISNALLNKAKSNLDAIYHNMLIHIDNLVAENEEHKDLKVVKAKIEELYNLKGRSDIDRSLLGKYCGSVPKKRRNEALQTLVEFGEIVRNGKFYYPKLDL